MATIKSYSDLQQSKKLAKILPLESADMFLAINGTIPMVSKYFDEGYVTADNTAVPCWSLAALLSLIPQEIFNGEYIINITEGIDNRWILTYDHYENRNHSHCWFSTVADNLVDACVAMIEKLNELNLL